jgi:hypothetical protein
LLFIGRVVSSGFYKRHNNALPYAISTLIIAPKIVIDIFSLSRMKELDYSVLITPGGLLIFWLPVIAAWAGMVWQGLLSQRRENQS